MEYALRVLDEGAKHQQQDYSQVYRPPTSSQGLDFSSVDKDEAVCLYVHGCLQWSLR